MTDLKELRALCDAATDIDPQTVRALIDEVERLREELQHVEEYLRSRGIVPHRTIAKADRIRKTLNNTKKWSE